MPATYRGTLLGHLFVSLVTSCVFFFYPKFYLSIPLCLCHLLPSTDLDLFPLRAIIFWDLLALGIQSPMPFVLKRTLRLHTRIVDRYDQYPLPEPLEAINYQALNQQRLQ